MFRNIFMYLKPAVFTYKQDVEGLALPKGQTFGIMAQDLEAGLMACGVNPDEYSILGKDQRGNLMVDYMQLIPLLITEIKDLQERVQELENASTED